MIHSSRYNAQEPSKSCVSQESLEASLWSGKTNDILQANARMQGLRYEGYDRINVNSRPGNLGNSTYGGVWLRGKTSGRCGSRCSGRSGGCSGRGKGWGFRGRSCGYGVCDAVFVQGCAALMPLNMGMGSTDQGVTRPRGRAAVLDGGGRLSSRSMLRGNVGESNRPIPLDRGMGNFGQSETRQRDRATVRNGWWSSRRDNPAFESELREGVCVGGNFSGLVVSVGDGKEKGGGGRSGVGWMDRSGRNGRGEGSMIGWMNGIGTGGRGVGMLNGRGRSGRAVGWMSGRGSSGRGGGWTIRSESVGRGVGWMNGIGRGVGMLNRRGRRRSGVQRKEFIPTHVQKTTATSGPSC